MSTLIDHPTYKYKTFVDIPTPEELNQYYAKKYFQNNTNYASVMTQVEIDCKRDQADFLLDVLQYVTPESLSQVVEVGSGEGFFLSSADRRSLRYLGVDFSADQLHPDHAKCRPNFLTSANPLQTVCDMAGQSSCVVLRHVIEHVPDALAVVKQLASVLASGSVLVVEAPHDFKPLQAHVVKQGLSEREYWLAHPDHLSYFSPEQLSAILGDYGFMVRECYADFPIELLLLTEELNYQKHKDMGKPAHLLRCEATHYLYKNTPFAELLALYRAFSGSKIGRSFTLIAQRI